MQHHSGHRRSHGHGRLGSTPDEWHTSVIGNLSKAGRANDQADDALATSMTSVRVMNVECAKQRDAVHSQLGQKVENTKELARQLTTRIRAVKCTIEHSDWSMQKLHQAWQSIEEPLDVCRGRLAARQKRPKREQVYDPFQEALLREEQELKAAKHKYSEAIHEHQRCVRELTEELAHLEADLKDKTHAIHIDTLCRDRKKAVEAGNPKLDKMYTGSTVPLREVLPEILSTPRGSDSGGRFQERERQKGTLVLIERCLRLEEHMKQRWQATTGVLEVTKLSTSNASKKTQLEMGTKIADTEILRNELTKQLKLTQNKISEASRVLNGTSEKLLYIEKPMTANAERQRIRGSRTPREATSDEVSEALRCQLGGLEAQKMTLQRQVDSLLSTLENLEKTRAQLNEDIADKDKALAIDRQCAAARNAAHGCYSYGVAKVGDGQRIFSDTASSMKRRIFPGHGSL